MTERKYNRNRTREQRRAEYHKYKNTYLKYKYGITLEEYEELWKEQNGVCAICGNPETSKTNRGNAVRNLAVDHDHTTGEVRGLLCSSCNRGIGLLKDDVDILLKAIEYLGVT